MTSSVKSALFLLGRERLGGSDVSFSAKKKAETRLARKKNREKSPSFLQFLPSHNKIKMLGLSRLGGVASAPLVRSGLKGARWVSMSPLEDNTLPYPKMQKNLEVVKEVRKQPLTLGEKIVYR